MSRYPDHQKHEAKRSLWDMDGEHVPKRYRNKGKGRGLDKDEVEEGLIEYEEWKDRCDGDCQICREC